MKESRVDPILHLPTVADVLPEYFQEEFPNFVLFLETYYDFLGQEGEFGEQIKDLQYIRDININDIKYLDNILYEVGLSSSSDMFSDPREAVRNFSRFFRVKGSEYSIEQFFRTFYGEDAQVEYPKVDVFEIGGASSTIGPDDGKVIQDGKLYQILSILIKSPVSIGKWKDLYKKYVHPAGFYFESEMQIHNKKVIELRTLTSIPEIAPLTVISEYRNDVNALEVKRLSVSNIGNSDILYSDDNQMLLLDSNTPLESGISYDYSLGRMYDKGFADNNINTVYVDHRKTTASEDDAYSNIQDLYIKANGELLSIYEWIKFDSDPLYDINTINQNPNKVEIFRSQVLSDYSNETISALKDIII
jgi:hypothetical protein